MALTPLDIHNKEFRRSFRGYNEDEVDDFLDQVTRDLEALSRERDQLRGELDEAKKRIEQYRAMENALQNAIVVAQSAADDVKANARKEAELILQEAQAEAERVIAAANVRNRQILEEADEAKRQYALFKARVRSLLLGQLELLDHAEAEYTTAKVG